MVEPARALPLRWGSYEARYLLGLVYIVAGVLLIVPANTYSVEFLLLGSVAHVGGWFVLPARGARRVGMAWPSLVACFGLLVGPQALAGLALPLLAWLVVRQRPALAYLVLVIPIGVGVVLAHLYTTFADEPIALTIAGASTVAAAWLARLVAAVRSRRP